MVQARLTGKGQVTIPKAIRDYLHLDTGSKIDFVIDENGEVKVISLNVAVESLSGILHRSGMKAASLADMEQAIAQGASDWT
ncbi:AbrB family transcriptional regulator [Pleurocapsa sp. CCALA 161]|uniref:AbrB/MazE/SpoVT family DNA-binding domain-containing protein n=1 Tax=Pleurocapsa sp. CCALA 161 TaxID=2107688 RepID=UPI000D06AE5A|nr:type II toxin-antitoxin system PrlF family antitoxin [Pleurocapsa sp. CCALA 161]PSB09768.1 AbrB family transcriptional regulator [Pleurocapsa sp. CCALA 161]